MIINKAYKIEIYPDKNQEELFWKAFGIKRFVYNNLLSKCNDYYQEHKKSYPKKELKNYITTLKQEHKEWMYDVPKSVHQNAYYDLMDSFKNCFNKLKTGNKRGKKNVFGFPQYKSKKYSKNSFRMDNDRFSIENQFIKFNIFGKVKMSELKYIPKQSETVKYNSATVSYRGGKYFVSVSVEEKIPDYINTSKDVIGIDLGIFTLATCSDGKTFDNPRAYKRNLKKLKRLQRSFSRMKSIKDENGYLIYSKRKEKMKLKIAKLHYKISEIRHNKIHEITSYLAKTKPDTVVIEDLNVEGMKQNKYLAQSIADASFAEFRRQLEYKCGWNNVNLYVIDRWFPSSKMCSNCGCIKEDLKLSDRLYKCDCGLSIDRDLNASINIRNYYLLLGK